MPTRMDVWIKGLQTICDIGEGPYEVHVKGRHVDRLFKDVSTLQICEPEVREEMPEKAELIMPGGVSFGSYKPASAGSNSDSEAAKSCPRCALHDSLAKGESVDYSDGLRVTRC